jgi:hypothetical protein
VFKVTLKMQNIKGLTYYRVRSITIGIETLYPRLDCSNHMTLVSVMAAVGISISFIYLIVGQVNIFSIDNHVDHPDQENSSSVQLSHVEDALDPVREGDAKVPGQFIINNDFVDPDDSCDFCTQVNYTTGTVGRAAIAYDLGALDLTESKRIVLFAMGQRGGEKIALMAAGIESQGNPEQRKAQVNIFDGIRFQIATQNITLSDNWQRYEIRTVGYDLKDIRYPFGFVLFENNSSSSSNQVIYLKGVTFDNKPAKNPVALLY